MVDVQITMPGGAQVAARLAALTKRLGDFRPLWGLIEEDFYIAEGALFDSEGATGDDGKWAPLSPRYAAYKAAKWPGRRILEREGYLRDSLTKRGAAGQIRAVSSTEMVLGTSVGYAGAHQFAKGRPVRKPIDPSKADFDRWVLIAETWLGEIASETFA